MLLQNTGFALSQPIVNPASGKSLPLGRETDYPRQYDPSVLVGIERGPARAAAGIPAELPFFGVDIWNAWELSWLDDRGRPQIATAEIRVPAASPKLVESKSLKLYLGSFAMSRYATATAVRDAIENDLAVVAGAGVKVCFDVDATPTAPGGDSIDAADVDCRQFEVDPELLVADPAQPVDATLHTHSLRSLCPVTAQPDLGSLEVRYRGPRIDPGALLQYVVSYREHNDFHEACVERIYMDLMTRCRPESLTVSARYQRRGGIDINPWRSSEATAAENRRLWRQ